MEKLIKYSIFTALVIIIYSAVNQTHTHSNLRMCGVVANKVIIQNTTDDKRISDIIHYLQSNNQKTTIDNDKQYKYKLFCQTLYRNNNQNDFLKSQISIKNQHTHFETDYPIAYYIYALNKIIT